MSSFSCNLHQIVFATKYRDKVLSADNRDSLIKFMWRTCENKKCLVFAINGVEDHMHIVLKIHSTIAVADLVKTIKVSSTLFIKENKLFPGFISWQGGYGHFTYSNSAKNNLVRYVENQVKHHAKVESRKELIVLMKPRDIDFREEGVE